MLRVRPFPTDRLQTLECDLLDFLREKRLILWAQNERLKGRIGAQVLADAIEERVFRALNGVCYRRDRATAVVDVSSKVALVKGPVFPMLHKALQQDTELDG